MQKLVIKNPVITEKSMLLAKKAIYTFKVETKVNKNEISQAIELLYNVKVKDVNIVSVKGKVKRVGKKFGKRSDTKKAYVILMPGNKIKEFEIEEDKKEDKKSAHGGSASGGENKSEKAEKKSVKNTSRSNTGEKKSENVNIQVREKGK
ncbi:MAG: 50S ribosomal protein L23 [Patescibacteria group bacterium]|jgi:large subunit ribosomal protein L23